MKMFFRTGLRGLVVGAVAGLSCAAAGETILLNDNNYLTSTSLTPVTTLLQAGSLSTPYSETATTTTDPNAADRSTTSFDFTNSHLKIGLDHLRDGSPNAFANSNGDIYFTLISDDPDAVFHYSLSGSYTVNDLTNTKPGWSFFSVKLSDQDVVQPLYSSIQQTTTTADSSFVLSGDSLTGTLEQGHTYIFSTLAFTQATNGSDGATATGTINLDIVETPEPGIVWAGGALLSILGARRILSHRKAVVTKS